MSGLTSHLLMAMMVLLNITEMATLWGTQQLILKPGTQNESPPLSVPRRQEVTKASFWLSFGSVPWPCSVRLVCPSCHSTDALGHVLFVWMDWGDCLVCHETSLWTDCLATAGVKHVLWVGGTFLELDRDKSRERFRPLGIRGSAQSLNDTGVAHFVEWCRCVYVLVHFVVSLCQVQGM